MALLHTHFYSEILQMHVSCEVILPQKGVFLCQEEQGLEEIPVLWLLHGGGNDETMWQRFTSIERYVEPFGMAVVMPSAEFSGYRNQVHGSGRYYDYMTKELPVIMHDYFGLSMKRECNYIAGMSMGGNGALKFGMANPEKYSVIGCLSAGFFDHQVPKDAKNLDPVRDRDFFIRFEGREIAGSEDDLLENARRVVREGKPVPRVFHSTGEQDRIMWVSHRTRDFFQSFEGNPFQYVYEEHPGGHTWQYWDLHIQRFLQFIQVRKD